MKTRIAIVGLPQSNKTLLANALSNITGFPFIRNRTMYEWYTMFNICLYHHLEWKDMFLIASSSFFERVEAETHFEHFISDGASFSELMYLKSVAAKFESGKKKWERDRTIESLENKSVSHAIQQYDFIVHANYNDVHDTELYEHLYLKNGIPYKVYRTEIIEKALREIVNDLELPVQHSIDGAIYQARINLFTKK